MNQLFADECIHTDLVVALRTAGFDVLTVKEVGLIGASDEDVYEFAKQNGRILITFDRGFGDIFRFDITKSSGIIIILIGQMHRDEIVEILLKFLPLPEKPELTGKLVIIGKTKIRISGK